MGFKPLDGIEKIGEFINKYTGSEYNYSEPSGEITDNYKQIGEVFGFPIWMDDNKRYENEFLDFPSLGDILNTVANTGIDFNTKTSECSACLTITFTIPLIQYPPITICLSKPECKKEEKEEKEEQLPTGCRPIGEDGIPTGLDVTRPTGTREVSNLPLCDFTKDPENHFKNLPPKDSSFCEITVLVQTFRLYWGIYWWSGYGVVNADISYIYEPFNEYVAGKFWDVTPIEISYIDSGGNNNGFSRTLYCNGKRLGDVYAVSWHTTAGNLDEYPFSASEAYYETYADIKLSFNCDNTRPKTPKNPIIKDIVPIPSPQPMDKCCEDIKKLLARIEKKVNEVHKVLNPESFQKKEVQMPANWIYPGNEGKPVIMEDYADLIAGVARLVDRRIGFLPQLVRIKDADPTKEGDQEMNLVVNSLADANRLILEYLLQAHGDLGGIQMMNAANLYESGIVHQIAVSMWAELQAISEYLDYDTKQRVEHFKMAFNPKVKIDEKTPQGLDKILPKFLKHTTQQVEVNEFRGGKTLKDNVSDIKRDTANTAASVTRKLSDRALDDLVEETQDIERLKRLLLIRDLREREGINDLPAFFDDAEAGYPSTESPSRKQDKPYGFQPTDKPKMKVVTKKSRKNKYKNNQQNNQQNGQ